MLRVDDLTAKVGFARKIGLIALIIIIIASAHKQEPRRKMPFGTAIDSLGRYVPAGIGARPIGRDNLVTKMNVRRNTIFVSGFMNIFVNRGAIRDRFFMQPWFETIAQRVHVGV